MGERSLKNLGVVSSGSGLVVSRTAMYSRILWRCSLLGQERKLPKRDEWKGYAGFHFEYVVVRVSE